MAAALPDWLDHLVDFPHWALVIKRPSRQVLWVNRRLASGNRRDRNWFVGRTPTEIWPERSAVEYLDLHSVDVGESVDSIEYAVDLEGNGHWFHLWRTPLGDGLVLAIGEDVTARLQLAGIRLLLGQGVVGESRSRLEPELVRGLIAGQPITELCERAGVDRPELLSKLSLLVSEHATPSRRAELPQLHAANGDSATVPDWVEHYRDVPCRMLLVEFPSRKILWVNRHLAEYNRASEDSLVGVDLDSFWSDSGRADGLALRCLAEQRPLEEIEMGQNLLLDRQLWLIVRCIPVGEHSVLFEVDDVTAKVRLSALRMLIGLSPGGPDAVSLDAPFAKLLLEGSSIANICAALELPESAVRSTLTGLVYQPPASNG